MTDKNVQRASEVLAAYGGQPEHWPPDERDQTHVATKAVASLQRAQRVEQALDRAMDQYQPATQASLDTLLARLGEQRGVSVSPTPTVPSFVSRWVDGLFVDFWRPIFAASVPVLIGWIIGMGTPIERSSWAESEYYAFTVPAEESP